MDTLQDARGRTRLHQARVDYSTGRPTNQTKRKEIRIGARECGDRRSGEIERGKCNNKGSSLELAIEHSGGKEKDRQMEGMHGFYKS